MPLRCNYVAALPIACILFDILNVSGFDYDSVCTALVLRVTVYMNTVSNWAYSITML